MLDHSLLGIVVQQKSLHVSSLAYPPVVQREDLKEWLLWSYRCVYVALCGTNFIHTLSLALDLKSAFRASQKIHVRHVIAAS